jgi:GAF domain-containing protein
MSASTQPTPPDVAAVLDAVAISAQQSIPSAVAVSLTLVTEGAAATAASSSDWAAALDRTQYEVGSGPSVDAAVGGEICVMFDAGTETRWPAYAAAALQRGARSSISVPIPVDDDGVVGSLTAFGTGTAGFTPTDRNALTRLAGTAAAALMTADIASYVGRSRALVDQAKGIVMTSERCSPADALDRLRRRAGESGRSLHEVAGDVISAAAE